MSKTWLAVAHKPVLPQTYLWQSDAEHPIDQEWATGNAYDVAGGAGTFTTDTAWSSSTRVARVTSPLAKGTYAWRLTVNAGDADLYSAGAQRTELGQHNPYRAVNGQDRRFVQGDDVWIAYQIYIPSGFAQSDWCSLQQCKCTAVGSGPTGIAWWRGKLSLGKSTSQTYGSESLNATFGGWYETHDYNRWLKILYHVKWSIGSDGLIALWADLNGQGLVQKIPETSGWTLKYGSDGNPDIVGARIGLYRDSVAQTTSVYFDGFTVASTRAAAEAGAF